MIYQYLSHFFFRSNNLIYFWEDQVIWEIFQERDKEKAWNLPEFFNAL